jgi:hypothetical protein
MDHACNELKFSPKRKVKREDENGGGVPSGFEGLYLQRGCVRCMVPMRREAQRLYIPKRMETSGVSQRESEYAAAMFRNANSVVFRRCAIIM